MHSSIKPSALSGSRGCVVALHLSLGLAVSACSAPQPAPPSSAVVAPKPSSTESAPPPVPLDARPAMTVANALQQASSLVGRTVVVRGAYLGWSGRCQGGPPVSRGDWMLEDADACLYVSGPPPQGMARPPDDAGALGRPLRVEGVLTQTPDGRAYLKASPAE